MTRIHVLLVGILLAGLVVGASTSVGASDGYADAEEVCQGVDGVVLLLEDGEHKHTEATLYAGTTVQVAICDGGSPEFTGAWELESDDGFEPHGEPTNDRVWTAEVTDDAALREPGDEEIELLELIDGPQLDDDAGISLTVLTVGTVTTGLDEPETVRFNDPDRADEFEEALSEYDDAIAEAEALTDELRETTDYEELAERRSNVDDIDVDGAVSGIQKILFDAAMTDDDAARALVAYDERAESTQDELDEAIEETEDQAIADDRDARMRLGLFALASLLGGGIVGTVVSRQLSHPAMKQHARERSYNSNATLSLGDLRYPILVAVVVLAGAVAVVVLLDGVTPLVEGVL